MGPEGPTGPAGPAGPQGPSVIIASAFTTGLGTNPNDLTANTLGFVGPTVTVTVANEQRVHLSAHKFMGSTTGASELNTYACYQLTSGGTLTPVGGGMWGGQVPAGTRLQWGISAVLTLAPGTYTAGMCARASTPADWDSNEWGYASALVFQQ